MDLKRLTEVLPLVLFPYVLYFLYIYTNKSDVVTLPFPPPKNLSWNTSGPTDKIQCIATSVVKNIATSDVKNIDTSDVKNIVSSDVKNIVSSDVKNIVTSDVKNIARNDAKSTARSDVKNIATSDVKKLRKLLESNPRIRMLNQSAIQCALCTIKQRDSDYKVPLKIHFIWVGSLFPNEYVENVAIYLVKNPKYEIYLWTDRNDIQVEKKKINVESIHSLPLINKRLILMEPNPAAKADMLRYEIIYHHGGIYVDIDSRAEKGFDGNFSHSFMTCNKKNR